MISSEPRTVRGDVLDTPLPWFPIVMLHRVVERTPAPNPYNLCISQTDLARLIGFLRRTGYTLLTVEDAMQAWEQGEPVDRLACLTFDDGYEDFYTHAMPVLRKLECPAGVYIVSRRLGGTNEWDAGEMPEARLLSEAQVREVAAAGFRVGAHSATHPRLPSLTPHQRVKEIAGAKHDIEALIEREVEVFVYPHWAQNPAVRREVFEAGYKAACGGDQPEHTPFLLHRVDLARFDSLSMRFHLHGWHYRLQGAAPVRVAKGALRGLRRRS